MSESYNHHKFGSYSPVADLSPYAKISEQRLQNPKFVFRFILDKVNELKSVDSIKSWTDVGCANGEFLHYLCQGNKECKFTGIDITPSFLEVARQTLSAYSNVELIEADILANKTDIKSDVVSCTGTFQIFPDPTQILNSLVDLVKPGGLLLIDGCFNPFDISMTINYLDESRPEADDLWRCDFNHHSEKMIRRILKDRSDVDSASFFYPVMDTEIVKVPNAPHINMWTEPRDKGGFNIINGMGWYFNPRFLIIQKR